MNKHKDAFKKTLMFIDFLGEVGYDDSTISPYELLKSEYMLLKDFKYYCDLKECGDDANKLKKYATYLVYDRWDGDNGVFKINFDMRPWAFYDEEKELRFRMPSRFFKKYKRAKERLNKSTL